MAECKVNNVNIVTNTCSVRSIIIVAEYIKVVKLTDSNLSDIRHKVVRNTVRVFAHCAALVSTDRVEITEKAD